MIRKMNYPIMICMGYVAANVAEAAYSISGTIALGIGAALMLFPRLPGFARPIGLGMVLASDTVQGWITQVSDSLLGFIKPEETGGV